MVGATLIVATNMTFHLRLKKSRVVHAPELARKCHEVLSSVEPIYASQTTFYPHIEIQRWGKLPWQKQICLNIEFFTPHNPVPLRITSPVRECIVNYLDLPGHHWLWATIVPINEKTHAEK
jgi:hypothetical protein